MSDFAPHLCPPFWFEGPPCVLVMMSMILMTCLRLMFAMCVNVIFKKQKINFEN